MTEAERDDSRPPRGYSWESFREGNQAATTHAAYSERRLAPLAERFAEEIRGLMPRRACRVTRRAIAPWSVPEGSTSPPGGTR
jgi:hypothetical protein